MVRVCSECVRSKALTYMTELEFLKQHSSLRVIIDSSVFCPLNAHCNGVIFCIDEARLLRK